MGLVLVKLSCLRRYFSNIVLMIWPGHCGFYVQDSFRFIFVFTDNAATPCLVIGSSPSLCDSAKVDNVDSCCIAVYWTQVVRQIKLFVSIQTQALSMAAPRALMRVNERQKLQSAL